MADFSRLAATAQRLIAANGRPITVVKFGSTPADDAKPWRGRREYHEAEVTGAGAFVPESMAEDAADAVRRRSDFVLFAAENDGGHDLRTFDAIEDGDLTWKIIKVTLVAPAATRIIYEFEVAR